MFGIALLLVTSCGPPKPSDEQAVPCHVYDLSVESNAGGLTVGWRIDCSRLISGYNIYIAPASVENFGDTATLPSKPHNDAVYPGDLDPDDPVVYYEVSGLDDGVLYRVAVRVVFADRTLSSPSKPVLARSGPRGEFELMARYSGERDGFSFALDQHVRADDLNNDLYYYTKDGAHYLDSPSRLDGFLRANLLMLQPKTWTIDEYIHRGNRHGEKPTEDRLKIREGDLIWMTTTEGHQVQLRVLKINGGERGGTVRLGYAYWPTGDAPAP